MKNILFAACLLALCAQQTAAQYSDESETYYTSGFTTQFVDVPNQRSVYGGTRIIAELPADWSDDQKGAFRYACDLWEEVLPTTFPIRIAVNSVKHSSNLTEKSVLSKVTPRAYKVIGDSANVPDLYYFSLVSYSTQIKATTFMEMTKEYDSDMYAPIFDNSYFTVPDIVMTFHEYQDKSFDDIFSFSKNPSDVGDKYDFVTYVLREIGKGLGYQWKWRVKNNQIEVDPMQTTPFEDKIISKLSRIGGGNGKNYYSIPMSGQLTLDSYFNYHLYAPNPWDSDLSLKYFCPADNCKLSKLLDWNYGRGAVFRDISDYATFRSFEYLLSWKGMIAVGMGGNETSVDQEGLSTDNTLPYGGTISFGIDNANTKMLDITQTSVPDRSTFQKKYASGQAVYYQEKDRYNPLYRPDGSTHKIGHTVSFMLNDGTWDVVYEDDETIIPNMTVNTSNLAFHEADSAYARNYDGAYRCRVVFYNQVGATKYQLYVHYYLLGALPQPVKTNIQNCKFLPEYDDPACEYIGVIKVGIRNLEGTKRVEVAQYDDGDIMPFIYEVSDFEKGYFLATVDKEFDTRFVITAYNENGYTKSETYTFHPLGAELPLAINFKRTGDTIQLISQNRRLHGKNVISDCTISPISKDAPMKSNTMKLADTNKIYIGDLPKGSYVLSVTDIHNGSHAYKFNR